MSEEPVQEIELVITYQSAGLVMLTRKLAIRAADANDPFDVLGHHGVTPPAVAPNQAPEIA
jgi:hypothetical protein